MRVGGSDRGQVASPYQTMMDNSEQIASLINEASETATNYAARLVKTCRDVHMCGDGAHNRCQSRQSVKGAAEPAPKWQPRVQGEQSLPHAAHLKETAHAAGSKRPSRKAACRSVREPGDAACCAPNTTAALLSAARGHILMQEVLSGAE